MQVLKAYGGHEVNRILHISLIALSCTALIGLGTVWGAGRELTSLSKSGPTAEPRYGFLKRRGRCVL
jgi:predicted small secreted protein